MAPRRVFPPGEVPAIPGARLASISNGREPLLFWVHTGCGEVRIGRRVHSVPAASAVWLPAGVGYSIRVEPGTVALPIPVPAIDVPPALNRIIEFEIPAAWRDWLVHQFAHNLGFVRGTAPKSDGLLELVAGSRSVSGTGTDSGSAVLSPPMPWSPAALDIARTLLRTPADDTELAEFARRLRIGTRTLQRQFTEETGLSFVRWRAAARIAAATAYLDAGRPVAWVGRQVGFATPAGFTRAFREHTGLTPSAYPCANPRSAPAGENAGLAQAITAFSEFAGTRTTRVPPSIPATGTWSRVNDFHVIVWVYRGSARVTFGDRSWRLRRGEAMWLPAGVRNCVELAAGSLLLPLGSLPGASPGAAYPSRVLRFGGEAESFLLHTVVANYTHLRPEFHDAGAIASVIRNAAAAAHPPTTPDGRFAGPVGVVLAAVWSDPADSRTLADWGAALGVESDVLHRSFVAVTGQNLPNWRAQLRMTLARGYLEEGRPVGEVARRLGYAHISGFSKVFRAAHEMSPRAYQRYRWRRHGEGLIDP